MKSINLFLLIVVTIINLSSCSNAPSNPTNTMALDYVVYVDSFPQTFSIRNKTKPNIDLVGVKNFNIQDSIIIFSTIKDNGFWSVYELPNYNPLGNFLDKGHGPNEFIQPPRANDNTKFTYENDKLIAYIYDFQKGELLKMNVDESIDTKELQISVLNDALSSYMFNFLVIDSLTYLCKEVNPSHTQQNRYLLNNNKRTIPPILQKLNEATIKQGEDINILTTMAKLKKNSTRVVEMPIGLNYLNIYTLDGDFNKTVCIGNALDNIETIQKKFRWNRIYTFADLRAYDDFFAVLYIGEEEKIFQTGGDKSPFIYFFDWDGNPLAQLKLDDAITSFDMDLVNNQLYTFDNRSENFYKYDIKNVLSTLK